MAEIGIVAPGGAVDVAAVIGRQKFGRYQLQVLLLCALSMFVDGFDTQAIGYVAPNIGKALALSPGALGPAFAAGGIGALLGTLGFAPVADRLGRKPVLIAALLFFALCSFWTATADSVAALMAMRFVTGLGLGGVVPNALALTAEFMPNRLRVTLVMIVWFGFSTGSGTAGPIIAAILQSHDWRAVFVFGGLLPMVIVPLLLWALPESLLVLTRREGTGARIAAILRRLDPRLVFPATARFVTSEKAEKGFPVALLFREGRAGITSLLWLMFFMNLMALLFMNSWLTTLLHDAGLSQDRAIVIAGTAHFGGIAGGFVMAPFCDWFNRYRVLALGFILSALSIVAIGLSGDAVLLAAIATVLAGFFTYGAQNTANAIAATSYPTAMRSSGVGWALGVGRAGQVVGPLVGGWLLSAHWPPSHILYVFALPALVAAVAAVGIGRSSARLGGETVAEAGLSQ